MRDARHSTGPGHQGEQTNGGVRTAAPPLVVETANRAGLGNLSDNSGPGGARAAPKAVWKRQTSPPRIRQNPAKCAVAQ